jgi:hypothetical protein
MEDDKVNESIQAWDNIQVTAIHVVVDAPPETIWWEEDVWTEGAKFQLGMCSDPSELVMDFEDPVTRVAMDAEQARVLAEQLMRWAEKADQDEV